MTSAPLEPEAYDCVAIVTAHSAIDYADLVERAKVVVDFRNATRATRRREGLEAVAAPLSASAQAGLGAWGPNLVRNFDVLADLAWICDALRAAREQFRAALPERARDRLLRRAARRPRRSRRS